jgi:hypothetical protein
MSGAKSPQNAHPGPTQACPATRHDPPSPRFPGESGVGDGLRGTDFPAGAARGAAWGARVHSGAYRPPDKGPQKRAPPPPPRLARRRSPPCSPVLRASAPAVSPWPSPAARTSRRGRDSPGSTPGQDIARAAACRVPWIKCERSCDVRAFWPLSCQPPRQHSAAEARRVRAAPTPQGWRRPRGRGPPAAGEGFQLC